MNKRCKNDGSEIGSRGKLLSLHIMVTGRFSRSAKGFGMYRKQQRTSNLAVPSRPLIVEISN